MLGRRTPLLSRVVHLFVRPATSRHGELEHVRRQDSDVKGSSMGLRGQ